MLFQLNAEAVACKCHTTVHHSVIKNSTIFY